MRLLEVLLKVEEKDLYIKYSRVKNFIGRIDYELTHGNHAHMDDIKEVDALVATLNDVIDNVSMVKELRDGIIESRDMVVRQEIIQQEAGAKEVVYHEPKAIYTKDAKKKRIFLYLSYVANNKEFHVVVKSMMDLYTQKRKEVPYMCKIEDSFRKVQERAQEFNIGI